MGIYSEEKYLRSERLLTLHSSISPNTDAKLLSCNVSDARSSQCLCGCYNYCSGWKCEQQCRGMVKTQLYSHTSFYMSREFVIWMDMNSGAVIICCCVLGFQLLDASRLGSVCCWCRRFSRMQRQVRKTYTSALDQRCRASVNNSYLGCCSHAQLLRTYRRVPKNGLVHICMQTSNMEVGPVCEQFQLGAPFQLLRGWLSVSSPFWFAGWFFSFLYVDSIQHLLLELLLERTLLLPPTLLINLLWHLNPLKLLNNVAFQPFTKNVPFQSALQGYAEFSLSSTWIR